MSLSRERAGQPDVGLSLKSSPSRAQRLAPPKHVLQMTVHEPLPDQRAKPAGRVSRLKAPRVHAESQRSGSTELFIIDDVDADRLETAGLEHRTDVILIGKPVSRSASPAILSYTVAPDSPTSTELPKRRTEPPQVHCRCRAGRGLSVQRWRPIGCWFLAARGSRRGCCLRGGRSSRRLQR